MNKVPYLDKINKLNNTQSNCIIVTPFQRINKESLDYKEKEIINLAENINLNVVYHHSIKIRKISPSQYFGKGQAENFKIYLKKYTSKLLIINEQISPIQQRNLELALNCKILDRTGLILEIFGDRAITKNGRLQVDLASLTYQKSRLVRSWTHLERQRGGFGFMGGPGERQIESDKRQIDKKINKIKNELKKIESNKSIQRRNRSKNLNPFISLVGYTNAGKSTLFNYLTKEDVYVKNQLFATLDTTMRKCLLNNKKHFILSDTVGFINDLPTELVVSFKTTLDEINFSDYLLHIIDISNPEWKNQKKTVENILISILKNKFDQNKIIEVWNKSDLLNKEDLNYYKNHVKRNVNVILLSSTLKEGKEQLLNLIKSKIKKNKKFLFFNFSSPTYRKKVKPLL
ncbi:MAG: GTPase HflX [Alphaproteobacteria bacterium MarineAlpha6_Bin6]|nr:GTPase HflX [Pelagibacteraceae bacterium]PPR30444.1 MAG: GTPase HflX [Alphaproteobacteria bacterium MarineAlpha6_Bin6]PPR32999.1 MAG: GTPase HflX [Alphaproteobacteria bacterium MarineAlpha6_Bin5]|tara:strand:- start:363 stop:1568 length:1206 start_codon:yes stop_codon:yes gene_type:complete